MEHEASSSSGQLGGRAIDRHNPIITDSRRIVPATQTPTPLPSCHASPDVLYLNKRQELQKGKDKCKGALRPAPGDMGKKQQDYFRKLSSRSENDSENSSSKQKGVVLKSCYNPGNLSSTPAVSARHLLGDVVVFDDNLVFTSFSPERMGIQQLNEDRELKPAGLKSSSFPSKTTSDQVVVLRVSLHCRGCARKVSKHLSKMEGVTSFNIDFAAKKVTVVGDVTPLSVLASVSKVKNARFWPFPSPAVSSDPGIACTQV